MSSMALPASASRPNGMWRETSALGLALALHAGLLLWNPVILHRSTFFPRQDPLVDIDLIEEQAPPPAEPAAAPRRDGFLKSVKDLFRARHPETPAPQALPVAPSRPRLAPLEFSAPVPHAAPAEELALKNMAAGHIKVASQPAAKPASAGPQLKESGYGVRMKDVPVETVQTERLSGTLPSATIAIPIGVVSAKQALERPPRPAAHPLHPPTGNETAGGGIGAQLASLAKPAGGAIGHSPATDLVAPSMRGKEGGIAAPKPSFDLAGPLGDRQIVGKVVPTYPEWAIAEGAGGDVQLYFMVNAQGMVQTDYIRVVLTSGHPRLDQWAMQALGQWRFAPSAAQGAGGETQWGMITFHFTLK